MCCLTNRCCSMLSTGLVFFIFNESSASDIGLNNVIHFDGVFAQKATWQRRQKHSLKSQTHLCNSQWPLKFMMSQYLCYQFKRCISSRPLLDPRRQLAPVALLLLYSGQSSAPYRGHPATPNAAAPQPAADRNRSRLLPLTRMPLWCINVCSRTTSCQGCKSCLPPKSSLQISGTMY